MGQLEAEIRELQSLAQQREDEEKKLTRNIQEANSMVDTRLIQSRKFVSDFSKVSMLNDTLTMKNFELRAVVAQQGSIKHEIFKSEEEIKVIQAHMAGLGEETEQLQRELDALAQLAKQRDDALAALVRKVCEDTSASWQVEDLKEALFKSAGTKISNLEIFRMVNDAASVRESSFRRVPSLRS